MRKSKLRSHPVLCVEETLIHRLLKHKVAAMHTDNRHISVAKSSCNLFERDLELGMDSVDVLRLSA